MSGTDLQGEHLLFGCTLCVCFIIIILIYSYFMAVWGIDKTAVPMCRGQLNALLPEAERPRAMGHRAVHGTEGQ